MMSSMISRRAMLSGMMAAPAWAAVERPNLLLILTDQQGHTAWSGCGNPYLKTPAMDRLAARGTTFSEAYCTYPVCSPSRSSIFTGRMPHETGVEVNGRPIVAGMPTMGEVFSAAGYKTVYAGKWHLPKSFDGMTGFEKLVGGSALGRDMDEPVARECAKWLRGPAAKEPFLMVASLMNPHDICDWIRQHPGTRNHVDVAKYPPAPGNMAVDPEEPECMQYHRREGYDLMSQGIGVAAEWRRDDVRQYLHDYYRMVETVDGHIGTVLHALEATGLDRKTVVIFASDHGEGQGGHRWAQKAAFYEESVHVPMVMAGPGVGQGVTNRLASLLDILPTFCDYAGVAAPADLRGVSLRKDAGREYVVSELRYQDASRDGRMVRSQRYKYVVFRSGANPEQLFDLEQDPGEVANLARRPEAAAELMRHRRMLADWSGQTKDQFRPAG